MPSLDLPFWPGWTAEGYYVPSAKGAPRPRCLGRIERIGETERLTAPAPRPEKPSDAEARPLRGMHWEGRWALIPQDDAGIFDARRLACIPFDDGSLEIPLDAPPSRVLALRNGREEPYAGWSFSEGRLRSAAS